MRGKEFLTFISGGCRVAASFFAAPPSLPLLRTQGLEIIELRLDLAAVNHLDEARRLLDYFAGWPVIATVRAASEGGQWRGDEAARIGLLQDIAAFVSAADVELATKNRREIIKSIKASGAAAIVSQHNFAGMDDMASMTTAAAAAFADGADVYKIAVTVTNDEDVAVLAQFAQQQVNPCIVIGMGDNQSAHHARQTLPAQGSAIAFAAAVQKTAPGQLSLSETAQAVHAARAQSPIAGH